MPQDIQQVDELCFPPAPGDTFCDGLTIDNLPPEVNLSILGQENPRKQYVSDHPILAWAQDDRQAFLDELLRLEGRCGHSEFCIACKTSPALFRCSDCLGTDMLCSSCLLESHQSTPLHRVKQWNGRYFERTSLKNLGQRIQLRHVRGDKCYRPIPAVKDDFVIIHTNGVHSLGVDFCGCERAEQPSHQLLRKRWFPTSSDKPRTAVSFAVLEQFHLLSFESKVSAYEFYSALMRLSDNTGLKDIKDRYDQFLRVIREWRHLKMLKRSSRGHSSDGVAETQEGELAVLCPACPQPGKNMTSGWRESPVEKQWLHGLFVAIDANFRLKRKAVSGDAADPGLSRGWAYFVEEKPYKDYLHNLLNEPQPRSSCSGHSAVNAADSKSAAGLAATGVGTVDCARHGFKLPGGVGDLQKGEKYINMDYLLFSALHRFAPLHVFKISYDIACQWHKNLWTRMMRVPEPWHVDHDSKDITFLVPKFHLPAHVTEYGEAPERGWANINPAASSTKEMGPGSHRDTIDDHFRDWNWKKVVSLGVTILRKIQEAIPEQNDHTEDFVELTQSLSSKYPDLVLIWEQNVREWEFDAMKPNPFEIKVNDITQASIRLQLAQADAAAAAKSMQPPLHTEVTPSTLIDMGIELEDQQQCLVVDAERLGQHATDRQKAQLQQRSNLLTRRIEAWVKIQTLFVPGVAGLREVIQGTRNAPHADRLHHPQDFPLLLPSSISRHVSCDKTLEEIEWKLREGQAHNALNELRQALRSKAYMLKFKDCFLRGQGANTLHHALVILGDFLGKVGWKNQLRHLAGDDIRSMSDGIEGARSEGRRRMSWIWLVCGYSESDTEDDAAGTGLQDAIRVEWCRTRARAYQWTEEVELLFEEQQRILRFLTWHADWWIAKANARVVDDPVLTEGLVAYAEQQASIRRSLKECFMHIWRDTHGFRQIAEGAGADDKMDTTKNI
ncbi:hypothetical protein L210DRAFT_3646022 [Boletus edulis BED1]|uniref:CxC2-like cysteine cluster KDZ transposase-associated domain-containing protein n=1 Tax=Boletus edulis BED1 TaxID=1328754 RepID=A0AAD4BSR1_BOLED|nr:hypothetical protein L210DRAFT_3646022 [Boletus edulis BED1]